MRRRRQDGLPRRHYRARVRGEVVLHGPDGVARCQIANLSLGGALLVPAPDTHVDLAVGTFVAIELHVGGNRGWLTAPAHVVRVTGPGLPLAVEFDELPPALEDAISDQVLAAVEAERTPPVLVVDGMPARRRRLARAVRRIGCQPIEASTPLEAIERMEGATMKPVAAVVGEELTQTGGAELADFFAHELPGAKVTLVRAPTQPLVEEAAPEDGDGAVVAVEDGAELTSRVEAVLDENLPTRRRG
jgi:hypothetical protein